MASLDEKVKLRFLQWQGLYKEEKPFEIVTETIQGSESRRTNLLFGTNGEQTITDIRGREGTQFALDSHGFAYRPKPCPFDGYDNKQRILEEYLPWAESIIKQEIGDIGRVFIFDWRLRRSDFTPRRVDLTELHQYLPVASTCHVDQSPWEMVKRCRKFLGAEAEELFKGRIRIINLWKPLSHTIQDRPIAVCDGSTVDQADLVHTDYVRRDDVQETMYLLHNDRQKWYYLSRQTPDEVLLIKIYDSSLAVKAINCPHSSFFHSKIPPTAVPRQSIEVRAFVFSRS
ncbi:hypothetical protein HO133_003242 [Letharia lupina]|uniref:Methyltransferase n=1 Tax=Letharia lupina TaxID=560253 RepID=A0A8H6CBA2_9LECA|nr:uncharacterized protein HO133_003242 [Letharia lupina]KAF6220111.1 hypothetical protein HO133_003242 [Letharia lupina]